MSQVQRPLAVASAQGVSAADRLHETRARHAAAPDEIEPAMTVSIPLVALLGVLVFVAYRYMGLRVWQLLLCLAFGFVLAATTAAPEIRAAIDALVHWLSGGSRP
jgi:hypothetical protein